MGYEDFSDRANEGEFNQSLAIIYRLDQYSKEIDFFRSSGNYDMVFRKLVSYFMECFGADGKDLSKTQQRNNYEETKIMFDKFNVSKKNGIKRIQLINHPETFLFDWECELRGYAQRLGLGMKKKGDGRYALMDE